MKKFLMSILFFCALVGSLQAQINNPQTNADQVWPFLCTGQASANFVALAAAGAGTGWQAIGANPAMVYQVATSAAATHNWSCRVECPTRTSSGKGCVVQGISWAYGIQTTAATSEGAPACQILTMPNPAAGESASTVAGTNIPLTSIPVVGSANLGTTTAGAFFNTFLIFTTPQTVGQYQAITCSLSLVQGAASAMQTNSPGGWAFGSAVVN